MGRGYTRVASIPRCESETYRRSKQGKLNKGRTGLSVSLSYNRIVDKRLYMGFR